MPCSNAMTTNVITISPDTTVAEALAIFHDKNIRSVPVVDENCLIIGVFSFKNLLKKILPVSVTLDEEMMHGHDMNISLEGFMGGAPWVAKRLKTHLPEKVSNLMVKEPVTIHSDSPLGEGIRLLVEYGSPLAVVKENTKELVGIISSQDIVGALEGIMTSLDKGEEIHE